MSSQYLLTAIAGMAIATFLTRSMAFIFAKTLQSNPKFAYLGRYLPPAIMFLLIVYCLRDTPLRIAPYGIPEFVSIAVVTFIHVKTRNVLASLVCGTLLYMILLPTEFIINFW